MATPDAPKPPARSYSDGRDELNLADFPISILRRQQPEDGRGRKLDQIVYESSTFDPASRRRIPQRVTLTTSSRYGLPTPADENVILALLYIAKRFNDLTEPRVFFSPHQLFQIMRWASNSRSYERLSQILLRLKSLTVLYENAWWDAAGRKYEEEFATGIIAEYRIIKTRVRRKIEEVPPSYVHWTPQFFKSLVNGNLKKLDLDRLFSLNLPTSQRMYRFLDKRFYSGPEVELDLRDFTCGHLGMMQTPNVAEIKRRLAPAIAELEQIGFIEPAAPEARYMKVRRGIWRVRFRRAGCPPVAEDGTTAEGAHVLPDLLSRSSPEQDLVRGFYRAWAPDAIFEPTEAELAQARELIARYGAEALSFVGPAVAVMKVKFPDAKRFGASLAYFHEAAKKHRADREHQKSLEETARRRRADREQAERQRAEDEAFTAEWLPVWESLSEERREEIRSTVLRSHPYLSGSLLRNSNLATKLYLEELREQTKTIR
jgi:Replication initiator protein A